MPHTPADELTAAADTLRELAERATHENRPRWSTGHTLGSRSPVVLDHPESPSVLIETYAARLEAVNWYIAAMDPGVGAALAKLLREIAALHERNKRPDHGGCDWCGDEDWPCNDVRNALVVARALLAHPTTGDNR